MHKKIFNMAKVAILALMIFNSSNALTEDNYLFEVLENTHFLNSWNKLIESHEDVEPWLADYAKTRNGPTTPATFVKMSGRDYQINFVCKTHECGDNQFYVMFSSDGKQAWGLLLNPKNEEIYFGNPDKEKRKFLRKAAYPDP